MQTPQPHKSWGAVILALLLSYLADHLDRGSLGSPDLGFALDLLDRVFLDRGCLDRALQAVELGIPRRDAEMTSDCLGF